MNFDEEYERLYSRIIENFEVELDKYIAIDITEVGKVEYLINEFDEYLFCQNLESELKNVIDELIKSSTDEEYNQYITKFVNLKRILNRRIINNKYFQVEDFDELYGYDPESSQNKHSKLSYLSKLDKKTTKKITLILYDELHRNGFINCKKAEFEKLFSTSEKIVWLGRRIDLLGLIAQLQQKKLISQNYSKANIAFHHFKSENNSQLNKRSLEVISTDSLVKEKYPTIMNIIKKIIELT